MKVLKTLVAAAGLLVAAACSDTSNQMTGIDPTFSKVGKGGFGDPHFTDETVCTFSQETGKLTCDYKIAGLSSNSTGLGLLIAKVPMTYYCDYIGVSRDGFQDHYLLYLNFYYYADKSGNAKGVVESMPLGKPVCDVKYISTWPYVLTGKLSDLQYHPLNNPAVAVQHLDILAAGELKVAEWALVAGVTTPKSFRIICDLGYWVPEVGLGVVEDQNE